MKTNLVILTLICLFSIGCEKKYHESSVAIGTGVEIYLSVKPYKLDLYKDYRVLDFDTIALYDKPILRYDDFLKYDTVSHKLTLGFSHDSLKIGDAGVYGRMFVVTVDKKPVYCGFKWPVISSIHCNWVFIEEPYAQFDNLAENEIKISFTSDRYADPRLDRRITDRLKADGRIK